MGSAVLIVEDEFLVAMDLENIVESSGNRVVGLAAEESAVKFLHERPEVALVDLNLRDGPTGAKIARRLSNEMGTRIIYISANPEQIGTPPANAVGYVQKPFSAAAVKVALEIAASKEPPQFMPHDLTLFNHPAHTQAMPKTNRPAAR